MTGDTAAGDRRDFDVVVVGAGLVGLALAAALAEQSLRVAIVDRAPVAMPELPAGDSGWDARVYAISPGSAAFLRSVGAWQELATDRVSPVEAMHIEGDAGAPLGFSAYDIGERALAWIVEERALRSALVPRVHATGVTLLAPATLAAIAWSPDLATLEFNDGSAVTSRLVIGADGLRSWVRQAAGIAAPIRSYRQIGVVANFACERAHRGRARQWFRDDGSILAWLPLPGRRISIVWSASLPLAQELQQLSPSALAARVAAEGRHALGELECITPPAGFPLQIMKVAATVGHRLALAGDAAHGVHPLAGQGVNLGFGDAEALAHVWRERGPVSDPGAPLLLDRYARLRAEPVQAMQAVTDGLWHLFGAPIPGLATIRNLGLAAADRLSPFKRLLAQSALR